MAIILVLSLSFVDFQGPNRISIDRSFHQSGNGSLVYGEIVSGRLIFWSMAIVVPFPSIVLWKILVRLKKAFDHCSWPLSMTIVHDHSIFPRPPWILRFPSLIEKIGPNSKLARFSLQIVQRSKRWRLRWSRRNPFSLMISGDSISGSSRDHLDMLTRSGESKIFAVFVESYCRFPQISYGHLMKLVEFPEEIEEKTIRNRSNLGVPENDRSRIRRTIWFTQCPSW